MKKSLWMVIFLVFMMCAACNRDYQGEARDWLYHLEEDEANLFFLFEKIERENEFKVFLKSKNKDGITCLVKKPDTSPLNPDVQTPNLFLQGLKEKKEKFKLVFTEEKIIDNTVICTSIGIVNAYWSYLHFEPIK
jgi:hypothetical protein